MNKNKMRSCLEIAYNCPLLLLVFLTSLFFFAFPDIIGLRDEDNIIAVFGMDSIRGIVENETEQGINNDEKTFETVQNYESSVSSGESVTSQKDEEKPENAGTRKEDVTNIENNVVRKSNAKTTENAYKRREEKENATKFIEYTPIATDSRYYTDAGKVALTTSYDYVLENDSYFNDAAFMGDSRTLGISDYVGFTEADFFCDNGMTIFKLLEDKGVTYQKTGEKVDMKKILQEKHYGKIYIMLGMNELGYGNTSMYMKQYLKVLRQIREWQPDAVIFIMANLHVSLEKNNMETEFNNVNINDKNVASARLANGRDIFYLDCNPLFTDEEGYLQAELTFDGVHLYAQHYDKWREFLLAHGVEKSDEKE